MSNDELQAAQIVLRAITDPDRPPPMPSHEALMAVGRHRLAPVAWGRLVQAGCATSWLEALRAQLRDGASAHAVRLAMLDAELKRVLLPVAAAGVRTVVIKGAALAHSHYPRPDLRPRGDSDLVIHGIDRDAVDHTLTRLGYEPEVAVDGHLITQQRQWRRNIGGGLVHAIDVHWRLFNPHAFAAVLTVDELLARAVPLPALGASALVPSAVHSLLIACVHRAAHHAAHDDLLWAYDIHLLVGSLDSDSAASFVGLARERQVTRVCRRSLEAARHLFGTQIPAPIEEMLAARDDRHEPTAEFLAAGRRQFDVLASDLQSLRGWLPRLRLLGQHLFPPAAYMRRRYGVTGSGALAYRYLVRIVRGVPRWFRAA